MKNLLSTICVLFLLLLLVVPANAEEKPALQILQQPTDCAAAQGERISTGLVAEGEGLRYQWYIANVDMNSYGKSSLTGPEYYVTMKGKIHNRKAYCVVTDKYGNSLQSDVITLTMTVEDDTFAIVQQPYSMPVQAGQKARAELIAEGEGLRYQWYFTKADGIFVYKSSLSGSVYAVTMKSAIHNRYVYCLVTDRYGRTLRSDVATLTMAVPDGDDLQVMQQPANASARQGDKARAGVIVRGENLRYQWYVKNVGMTDFGKSSLTGPEYYVTMKPHISGRQVYCMITDGYGRTMRTDIVTLTMQETTDSHVHGFFEDEVFASCGYDGYYAYFCMCGEYYTIVKPGTKLTHQFSDYENNWDETCSQNATETAYCSCGATRTREIENSKAPHNIWDYYSNNDATCEKDATETGKCENCEATETRIIPDTKLPHSFTNYRSDNNATCKADGTETATCDHCNATHTRSVAGSKLDHSFTTYIADNNASCKANGTETATCDHCDATESREIPNSQLAHTYANGSCVACGDTPVGVKITAQPKNVTIIAGMSGSVSVTATGDGLTYVWYYKDAGSSSFQKATATGKVYTITMTDNAANRQAYCIISDKYGNQVQTNTVTFTKKDTSSGDGATGENGDIFIPFN